MPTRMHLLGFCVVFAALVSNLACGPNPYDSYLAAMRAHGAAERTTCQLVFDRAENAHIINSDRILVCLRDIQAARDLYQQAAEHGYQGQDLATALQKIDADVERLQSMLNMVQLLERDAQLTPP